MKINIKKIALIFLFLIFLSVLGYLVLIQSKKKPDGLIILSGRIEGRQISVSPKVQGRIIKLLRDEGDKVRKQELLCEIDSDQITARYRSQLENSEAAFFSVAQAKANLGRAKASFEKSKADYDRYSHLLQEELVSKSEFDRIKMQYESSLAEVEAALKVIAQAEANHRASKEKLREILSELNETKIYAPSDGVILTRPVEIGEVVNPGSVLYVIVDPNRLYVKVYVPEPDIGKLKLGAPARIYIDAYPDKFFNGRVTKIYEQAEFTPKNVETKEERVKLVFGVEVSVENPEGILKPGMPADVVIKWKESAPWIKPQ